jgi:hypothetical protein
MPAGLRIFLPTAIGDPLGTLAPLLTAATLPRADSW